MPKIMQYDPKPITSVPPEIWLKIASFLPSNFLLSLYSVNRVFYTLSMQARWDTVVLSIAPENTSLESFERVLRLADPEIRKHVRQLRITDREWESEIGSGYGHWRSVEHIKHRLPGYMVPKGAASAKSYKVDWYQVRELACNAVLALGPVVDLEIELCHPILRVQSGNEVNWTGRQIRQGATPYALRQKLAKQNEDLLQGVWKMVTDPQRSQLQRLRIFGNPGSWGSILKPCSVLGRLKELCIELDGHQESSEDALYTVLLPFVGSVAQGIETLKIAYEETCTLSLRGLLFSFPRFPLLKSLEIHAHFDLAFRDDLTGAALTEFISAHSKTIRHLNLALGMDSPQSLHLSTWLRSVLTSSWLTSSSMQDLEISKTGREEDIDAVIHYIAAGGGSGLTSLTVNGGYWATEKVKELFDVFPANGGMMREMSLGVQILSPGLWDILATKAWWLEGLKLRAASYGKEGIAYTGRHREKRKLLFCRDMRKHCRTAWHLKRLEVIGQDFGKDEMAALRESVPNATVWVFDEQDVHSQSKN